MIYKVEFDMRINPANEPQNIVYSVFIVSLNPQNSDQLVANMNVNLATLTEGTHYTDVASTTPPVHGGQVILNPNFFKIHKQYKFAKGQNLAGLGGYQQKSNADSQWRKQCTLYPKVGIRNGRGDFDLTQNTFRNEAQLYVLLFSSNHTGDMQSPTFTCNTLVTLKS